MDNLIDLYQQFLNLKNYTFSRITHSDAMVAIVYKLTHPTNTPLILKICERSSDYFREVYFLKLFNGMLPVAPIVNIVEPTLGLHGAILMEYLPGRLLQASDLNEKLAYDIGSILACIHINRLTSYGDLTQPHNLSLDPCVNFTAKFKEGLDECEHNLPQDLLEQCRNYYDLHINLLKVVDGPCVIHRDFRPGNIIVNNGKLEGIIDWASGRAGFATEDFCPLEIGEWPINSIAKKSFLAGYASIRPIPDYEAIMPLLILNRRIATLGFLIKHDRWDNTNYDLYQVNRANLENFFNIKN
jgi:Ser/Thr protein kinase RdoA (MazF antagonist)